MRVYKRGAVYWFELVFEGRRYQQSTKTKNLRVAGQVASAFHTALVKGEVGITERKKAPVFGDAMAAFLEWSRLEHSTHPGTTKRYLYSSFPLIQFFRDRPLDAISPALVEEYKSKRATTKSKSKRMFRPATVNRELACLRAMFNHAGKGNDALLNPVSKVRFLPEDNQQERVLTYTEEAKYMEHASPTLRAVATMILETGMRPEEVFTLQASSVDLDQGYLRVLRGKTPAARRRIELTPAARAVLEPRVEQSPAGYLFPNERDARRPLPGLQSAHARALKDSALPHFRIYDLRHTFATRAAEAGVDLITLAAMLGHSRIQMVLRYAHPTQSHQTGAMTKVLEHKTTQRAKEKAKAEAVSERAGKGGIHIITRVG